MQKESLGLRKLRNTEMAGQSLEALKPPYSSGSEQTQGSTQRTKCPDSGDGSEWARNTDGWVVPAQGALPDAEGIVQQMGSLLVLILVPGKQHK